MADFLIGDALPLVFPPIEIGSSRWDYRRPLIFGVINTTPDSFSDGGLFFETRAAVAQGEKLVRDGADALDVGGESTRHGSSPISASEEISRILPVIESLRDRVSVPISVDTYKAEVADVALKQGATIINDISGGFLDPDIFSVAAKRKALLIIGHLRGFPRTMQDSISFEDVVSEVDGELRYRIGLAIAAGVSANRIWVDPSIGFGKTAEHCEELIAATGRLRESLGYPIMVGPSRKSFIGKITGEEDPSKRLMGTAGAAAVAISLGADALRLHDVGGLKSVLAVATAIARHGN